MSVMDNISGLIKTRTSHELVPFPISDEEMCRRYEGVTTPMVNDVLREMEMLYQTLPNNILPLREGMKVAGVAFTIKGSKNLDIKDEMIQRAQMLEAIPNCSVIAWDTNNDDESAQWGEIMTMAAKRRGCRGAIVDGGVRDTDRVLEQDFPVFCKFRSSNGMMGRFRTIGYQIPVMIGNVHIYPGDIVFGDIDGCIVVPRGIAFAVLERAEQIRDDEVGIKEMVQSGINPVKVVEQGGYF